MDKREAVLREALNRNDEETNRWKKYKDENDTAVENLDRFSKYLTVDVMVPIGQKAYMPGQLVHTNEVLVGHYQGYFSKCSAHKAKDICKYRIKTATDTLDKLKDELDLWQNKLEKPYADGVFPNMENKEIIEDYDEEQERIWREKHKLLVKQAKVREKSEREQAKALPANSTKTEKDDDEIFKMLQEAELMEELENELENLQIDDVSNETIKKLMAGDLKLPPGKPRQMHSKDVVQNDESPENERLELQGIVKKTDLVVNAVRTNNNNFPNPELQLQANDNDSPDETVDEYIKEQAKYLTAVEQVGFYEYHIKIMQQKLLALPLKTQDDLNKKVDIINSIQNLEELLEMAEDAAEAEEEEDNNTTERNEIVSEGDELKSSSTTPTKIVPEVVTEPEIIENQTIKNEKNKKRRISFALQNETLEFRRNETVSQMLPKLQPPQQHKKDVIKLDGNVVSPHKNKGPIKEVDRKQIILNKVEDNLKFIAENQSTKDFKLVDKILESAVGNCHTLTISFQHSNVPGGKEEAAINSEALKRGNDFVPGSPADFYLFYLENTKKQEAAKNGTDQVIYTNAYVGEDKVKVPLLKENDRSKAFEDKRMEFCKPETAETKSILRNKYAVEREQHNLERKNNLMNGRKASKKNKALPVDEEEYMSAYYKVMSEVVEKPLTEPEPLPECKYIDAHTPKKRVSRFKASRDETEKI